MEHNKKEYGKVQWFFFVILIPLVFTVTLAAVILSVAGFNIRETASGWIAPLTGTNQKESVKEETMPNADHAEMQKTAKENKELTSSVSAQKQEIKALENDVQLKENKIAGLTKEVEDLRAQLEETSSANPPEKDITKLYEGMSAGKAASILPLLEEKDAMKILKAMKDDQVTDIFEKMSPEDAALYTGKLAALEGGETR
ncbi:hypothetical protein CEF21_11875 [Bacillus sp. FJAT-42376]|uniref:MotE family protein n=1 Tax=Bacillus sp. FJAT-42376 TaxID=2014076 RepID=UPI000F50666A|nr:hypothetical protein [Bacillus sp. FJAT-42376]AZB42941.1 hypothetical protein CEF21_11875 [Bacillus sp. FJAT-42376]